MANHFLRYYGFLAFFMKDLSRIVLNAKMKKDELENFTTGLSKHFTENITKLPSSLNLLKKTGAQIESAFNEFDIALTPVLSHSVPKIGYFDPTLPYEEISRRAVSFASYTGLQNITGSPAISLPMGMSSEGLPIGAHLIAPLGQDRLLLELSLQIEYAKPFKKIYE
jgi:amidase